MTVQFQDITFRHRNSNEPVPYELLLLADPSKTIVNQYLNDSEVFIAILSGEVIGVIALLPLTDDTIEIKNIAVKPELQGKGIGSFLIRNAIKVTASLNKYKSIYIATANSSIGQLYLYQKLGFELCEIKKDFFLENYSEPIYENGIQAKHLLLLKMPF